LTSSWVIEWAMRSARFGSVAANANREVGQRSCLVELIGNRVGDAFDIRSEPFGAVWVGGIMHVEYVFDLVALTLAEQLRLFKGITRWR